MNKYFAVFVGLAIALKLSSLYAQSSNQEQEVEFHARSVAFMVKKMEAQERAIAALEKKQIAVGSAADLMSKLAQYKKETGKFNQQEYALILATALSRLAHLSQVANMSPEVIACHTAEARSLENLSQGKPAVAAQCRADAYGGASFESESIIEMSKPSWRPNHELIRSWVVNAFSYAESMGKISNYGAREAKPN